MTKVSDKVYKSAIVGVGAAGGKPGSPTGGGFGIGHVHGKVYGRSENFELVAAADVNAENLAYFRSHFGGVAGYPSLESMLAEVKPDVVSLCTYVGFHLSMIETCVNAGVRAILCEKPFVKSPQELATLRELVARTDVEIMVPHFRRYLPAFQKAREVYASGRIGERLMVTAAIGDQWDLSEWGSHWLDMFRFFHDDAMPESVLGQARVRDRRGFGHAMEDHALAYFNFSGGGRASLETGPSWLQGGANMVLTGTEGAIHISKEADIRIYSKDGLEEERHSDNHDWIGAWVFMADTLAKWLADGTKPDLGFDHVSGTAEVNLGSYMSMVKGDRIDFPMPLDWSEWPVEELARRMLR
ncbi:MAG: hypothetical protein ABS76_37960 [Pelagibacterium sp. SCN 64-44]|nr:MAG: hypothetical protein ABS76_37960 [Pelagibacterium sp. SCN 64-44]